jgi:ribosomal protein S12 methylthiotransferase
VTTNLQRHDAGTAPADARPLKVSMISLGCPKNLVDSEMILGDAGMAGLEVTPHPEESDVVVVNTCSFIDSAKEESVQTILEACELKRAASGPRKVVVTGCMAQRYGEDLRREIPEIDAIVGLGQYAGIGRLLLSLLDAKGSLYRVGDPDFACQAEVGRLRLTPQHYAYLRISEGCDNPCTFCAIPQIRGRFRSKPLAAIEAEARELVASGARELVVISQDTTSYGVDLEGKYLLPELLELLAAIDGVRWIRLLYVYPACFSDAMVDAIARIPQVIPYVDIPLQHISENMLRRMGRRLSGAKTRQLLDRMRERIDRLYLRTTFIVGFPGEREEDFAILRDYVRQFRFERLGVFEYSPEEGTPAVRLPDPVPPELVRERHEELMLLQQEIAFAQNRGRRGEVTELLIDGQDGEGTAWIGRSYGEAPEIDPVILVPDLRAAPRDSLPRLRGMESLAPLPTLAELSPWSALEVGRFVKVRVVDSNGYDLIAEPAG